MLVSFIIPSYDSADTIRRCLDSIYSLPLSKNEFEVVFVDDCSTDNTIEIIQGYHSPTSKQQQSASCNLFLLRQPMNGRQGAARNRGLSIAQGDYICFVDSDDTVAEGIVSAIKIAQEQQADMVAFHFVYANESGDITTQKEHLQFLPDQIFSGVEMQNAHPYWCSAPWAYIYRKSFLEQYSYPFYEGVLYEDSDFVAAHLYYAEKMAYSPETGYVNYYREGSTTHSTNHKNYADYLLLGTRMLSLHSIIQQDIYQKKKTDKDIQLFADNILEGSCWNVSKPFNHLFELKSRAEITSFYKRVDHFIDRNALYSNPLLHKFDNYWNFWSIFCIKHKNFSIALNTILAFGYKAIECVSKQSRFFRRFSMGHSY